MYKICKINLLKLCFDDGGVVKTYVNDSICGTWEKMADALFPEGSAALSTKGWQAIDAEQSAWAEKIAPFMDVNNNASPSFRYFRAKIMELVDKSHV